MKIPLSNRLLACCAFIRPGDRVADIGCDHGYLGIHLLKNGIAKSVIAADVNEAPLQSAMRNAVKFGVRNKMSFHLSDGVRCIPRDFDVLVCAGMGADTIMSILSAAPWLQCGQYRIILQCQSKRPELRQWLYDHTGFRINRETLAKDGKFVYSIMEVVYDPGHSISPAETYITPQLLEDNHPLLPEYYQRVIHGVELTVNGMKRSGNDQLYIYEMILSDLEALRSRIMVTVSTILSFLNTIAPTSMKESWDNVGLNCGHANQEVRTILVALDPSMEACKEAKEVGADLLLTHHALIWKPGFVTDQTDWGKKTLFLIENGIAHINAHTNLDCAPGGVNDHLAELLGLDDIQVISPMGVDDQGREWGLLRMGYSRCQSLDRFLSTVKEKLNCEGLRYVDGGKPVCKVAVGGGACASELMDAVRAGCDTFVTSDVKYNQFWDAQAMGLTLIDAGHFHTENPIVSVLADKISAAFPEIQVIVSQKHHDCMKFY